MIDLSTTFIKNTHTHTHTQVPVLPTPFITSTVDRTRSTPQTTNHTVLRAEIPTRKINVTPRIMDADDHRQTKKHSNSNRPPPLSIERFLEKISFCFFFFF